MNVQIFFIANYFSPSEQIMRRSFGRHHYDGCMKKAYRQDILHGPVTENLILLMYPILICGLFQQLYQMADAVVVGRFAQGNAIAIVGGSASMLISLLKVSQ